MSEQQETYRTKADDLIGKKYQLLDVLGGVITEFEIMFAKNIVRDAIAHEDGSFSKSHRHTLVSNDGFSWFIVYGGKQDKIIKRSEQ